jgi:hypothetical protein
MGLHQRENVNNTFSRELKIDFDETLHNNITRIQPTLLFNFFVGDTERMLTFLQVDKNGEDVRNLVGTYLLENYNSIDEIVEAFIQENEQVDSEKDSLKNTHLNNLSALMLAKFPQGEYLH